MSSRHLRRVVGKPSPAAEELESQQEYEPLYAQKPGHMTYAGLVISSNSESECESTHEKSEEEKQNDAAALPKASGNKKKNLKKKGKGKGYKPVVELDEVERSVQEVNAMLGSPPPSPAPKTPIFNQAYSILTIDAKHLNVATELKRLFGPEEHDHSNRRSRVPPNRALLLKRVLIHPNKETAVYDFKNSGISMTKYREEKQRMYFVFNHDEHYQKMHHAFLVKFSTNQDSAIVMYLNEARQNMHVEALLEISDRLFRVEENSMANEIIENIATYLQYVADPQFILSKNNVRLEYKFIENRVFHVTMLKYIYLLTNKACHRTALEIAKMMLLVDPNDPLNLLMVIDVLALRAREHEWLIKAIAYFDRQREAGHLYNIMYSKALAHYHVAVMNKHDLTEADKLIQDAMLAYPQVFVKILELCNVSNAGILSHKIFEKETKQLWSAGVDDLNMIYAKMTSARWNEPDVIAWLVRNGKELVANYDKSKKVRVAAKHWTITRNSQFEVWPKEILRHMSIIRCMSKLILETPLTSFFRPTCAWDPLFDVSVNRYKYVYPVGPPSNVGPGRSPFYSIDVRNEFIIRLNYLSTHPILANLSRTQAANYMKDGTLDSDDDDDEDDKEYEYDDDEESFAYYDMMMKKAVEGNLRFGSSDEDEDEEEEDQ